MAGPRVIHAAGGVVWRPRLRPSPSDAKNATPDAHPAKEPKDPKDRVEVLIVHRPGYDDWTFPKGKPDRGESLPVTAVREIQEETGYSVRLGHPLPETMYRVKGGMKRVTYWVARPVGKPEKFKPNSEIDEIRWVRVKEARKLLTYDHDRVLLKAFLALRDAKAHRTRTLVILRHAQARTRNGWKNDDLERPLTKPGMNQAKQLAPLLRAYGIRRVVTSPAARCAQTVEGYARSVKALMEVDDRLTEETKQRSVERSITTILNRKGPIVVCSHRPTLPWIFATLRIEPQDLAQGEGVIVHHRKGRVVAVEPFAHRSAKR